MSYQLAYLSSQKISPNAMAMPFHTFAQRSLADATFDLCTPLHDREKMKKCMYAPVHAQCPYKLKYCLYELHCSGIDIYSIIFGVYMKN